jgi:hypothetical protein
MSISQANGYKNGINRPNAALGGNLGAPSAAFG